jgi:hypothetical protein
MKSGRGKMRSLNGVVDTATNDRLDDPGIEPRQKQQFFLFSRLFIPALRTSQPPIQWVSEFFPEGKTAEA